MTSHIHIRQVEESDFTQVWSLIHQLAKYELAEDQHVTTPQILLNDYNSKLFDCLVAENKSVNSIVGICFFNFAYSTWAGKTIYLEDIIVDENHRRLGIGSSLFNKLLDYCKSNNVKSLRWQALNWNQLAIDFYKKFNAVQDAEWINFKIFFN